jgi:hypothetical protein
MSNTNLFEDIQYYEELTKHRCNIDSTQIQRMEQIYRNQLAVTTKLDLSHNSIDNRAVRSLCTILMMSNNNIKELILTHNTMDMISLIYIIHALQHPNCVLTSLDLSNNDLKYDYNPIGDREFEGLDQLRLDTEQTSQQFRELFNLGNLQKLYLKKTNIDENFVGLILSNANASLIELDLSENNLYRLDLTLILAVRSKVKKLDLSFNNLTLFPHDNFPDLETLNLSNNRIGSGVLKDFFTRESMKNLTSLDVSNSFTDTVPVDQNGWLNYFGNGNIQIPPENNKLTFLNVENTALNDDNFLSIINSQTKLTDLNISRNVINNTDLQNLFNPPNKIEKLSVSLPNNFLTEGDDQQKKERETALSGILTKQLRSFSFINSKPTGIGASNDNISEQILNIIKTALENEESRLSSLTLKKAIQYTEENNNELTTPDQNYFDVLKKIITSEKLTYLDFSENEIFLEKDVADNLKKAECRLQTLKLHGPEIKTKNEKNGTKNYGNGGNAENLSNVVGNGDTDTQILSYWLTLIRNNKYAVGNLVGAAVGGQPQVPPQVTKDNIKLLLNGLIDKNCKLLTLDLRGYGFHTGLQNNAQEAFINGIQLNTTLTKLDIDLDNKYLRKTIDVNKKLAEYISNSNYPALGSNLYSWDKDRLDKFYISLITPNNRKHDTLLQQIRNKIYNIKKQFPWWHARKTFCGIQIGIQTGLCEKQIGTYIDNLKYIQQELKKVKGDSSYSIVQNNKKFNITVSPDGEETTIAQFKDLSQQDKKFVIHKLKQKKVKQRPTIIGEPNTGLLQ